MRRLLFVLYLFSLSPLWALDRYEAIGALLSPNDHPRLLNVLDVPSFQESNAQALLSPDLDVDHDGHLEATISGVYDLRTQGNRYFLLVAQKIAETARYTELFYEESDTPIFIFLPGTTGEGDPGNQAFSASTCTFCSSGYDFLWDANRKTLLKRAWKNISVVRRTTKPPITEIKPAVLDVCLKTVSALPDVQEFIRNLKKKNGQLGTAVEETAHPSSHVVKIYEKKADGTLAIYDEIMVDSARGKIIRRQKSFREKGEPKTGQ